jgi:hypothetical protein
MEAGPWLLVVPASAGFSQPPDHACRQAGGGTPGKLWIGHLWSNLNEFAMLQIVHDVAPGASRVFATAALGQAAFAQSIADWRTTGGADMIVDDLLDFAEPFFQEGIVARGAGGADGKSCYNDSWLDQHALFLGGLWRFFHSRLITAEEKTTLLETVRAVVMRLESAGWPINYGTLAALWDLAAEK